MNKTQRYGKMLYRKQFLKSALLNFIPEVRHTCCPKPLESLSLENRFPFSYVFTFRGSAKPQEGLECKEDAEEVYQVIIQSSLW